MTLRPTLRQAFIPWGCAFSPDGTRVLSASHDGCLCEWDAADGQRLRTSFHAREGQYAALGHTAVEKNGEGGRVEFGKILDASPNAWKFLAWHEGRTKPGKPLEWDHPVARILPVLLPHEV